MTDNMETDTPEPGARTAGIRPGRASLAGGIIVGGSLAAMGGIFIYLLLAFGYAKAVDSDNWKATPCTILQSSVKSGRATPHSPGLSHELEIAYRYTIDGVTYDSTRYRRMATRSAHASQMEAIARRFPLQSQAVCYVNPRNPAEAILKKDTKAVGYTIWFPGLFVVGGVGIVVASVRRALRKS